MVHSIERGGHWRRGEGGDGRRGGWARGVVWKRGCV